MGHFQPASFPSAGPRPGPQDTADSAPNPDHALSQSTPHRQAGLSRADEARRKEPQLCPKARPSQGAEWGAQKTQEPSTQLPSPSSTPQERGGWLEVLQGMGYPLGGLSTLPTDLTFLCSAPCT